LGEEGYRTVSQVITSGGREYSRCHVTLFYFLATYLCRIVFGNKNRHKIINFMKKEGTAQVTPIVTGGGRRL